MSNFDFHNLLFPTEFERLCLDILKIKEPLLEFRTFGGWKDNGIDILCTSENKKIIGQCKRYNPHNYHPFKQTLKKEVKKCKKENPERYILFTSITLGVDQFKEIEEMFEGFLRINDIIDSEKLNEFLRDEKKFGHLLKVHSKLLIPNLLSVESALYKVVYRKYYNNSKTFLHDIFYKQKLFHSTEQLPHLIQKLEEDKVIILSGNPGVGKTTMAMMIANYFISKKECEVFYLDETDYPEISELIDKNRLIVVDDFWGQKFSPKIEEISSTYQRRFVSVIKSFEFLENSYLILVSRDYILKDILSDAEPDTEKVFNQNKYLINIEEYSIEDKLRIFLNHLLFYDYDLSYIDHIKYDDTFEDILSHKNYSPRILEMFINQYKKEEHQHSYDFYKKLNKYLDNPADYWKFTFKKLSPTAQLILIVLLVSSDPMDIEDLRNSFNSIQEEARQNLNLQILPIEFNSEVIKLEEFYISIEKDASYNMIFIKFQSPGIKDYLLEYIRTDGYLWVKPIIKKAIFFNQLTFIFSTGSEKIDDYESDIFLYGQKIILDGLLKKDLRHKLLFEFENLQFSNYEERAFSDQLSKFHSVEDTKYLKLLTISKLFDINVSENNDVKQFVLNQILTDFDSFKVNKGKVVSHRSMIYLPNIIKLIFPYLDISPKQILNIFFESITFASEYDYFYDFKDIFPVEFENFFEPNILKIRQHIKELIPDNIDYYLYEDKEVELDNLLYYTIEELSKKYKFRITTKYVKELESSFDMKFPFLLKKTKVKSKKSNIPIKKTNRFKAKPYQSIIEEYLPNKEDNFSAISYLNEKKYTRLIKCLKTKNCTLSIFTENAVLFENLCKLIISENIEIESLTIFEFVETYVLHFAKERNISINILTKFICELNDHLEQSNYYSITQTKLKSIIKATFRSDMDIDKLSPIVISYDRWYKLSSDIFVKYFLAKKISCLNDPDVYKEEIIDALLENIQILNFLQSVDKVKLWNWFINPELDRLIEKIDFTNEKSLTLTFINFFQAEFDLRWNKKERNLESYSSSNTESHFENIFSFIGIDFFIQDFESYFESGVHTKEALKRLFINTKTQKHIYSAITKTIPAKTINSCITEEPETIFKINLSNFLTSSDNFELLEKTGLVYFTNQTVRKIEYTRTTNNYDFLLPNG